MPTYEYQCDSCHRVFEIRQRISEPPLATCDACGGAVRRLLSAAPFILKGDGWYVTDYPSKSRKKALESEKSASSAATPSGDKSASGDRSAGDKSASGEKSAPPATGSTTSTPSSSASSSPAPSGD